MEVEKAENFGSPFRLTLLLAILAPQGHYELYIVNAPVVHLHEFLATNKPPEHSTLREGAFSWM